MLDIEVENERKGFKPGEQIHGVIKWNLADNPESLELTVFWMTEGKGETDVGIVKKLKFEYLGNMGEKNFEFTAPVGPYSFSGKTFSILWYLELTDTKTKECTRRNIFISPTGGEIVCKEKIADFTEKKFKNKIFHFPLRNR